jgi:hypothetical protein
MSADTVTVLLNQYWLPYVGVLIIFAAGVALWNKVRKIEVRLVKIRAEVDQLNLIETRRFLGRNNRGSGDVNIEDAVRSKSLAIADGEGATPSKTVQAAQYVDSSPAAASKPKATIKKSRGPRSRSRGLVSLSGLDQHERGQQQAPHQKVNL